MRHAPVKVLSSNSGTYTRTMIELIGGGRFVCELAIEAAGCPKNRFNNTKMCTLAQQDF